MNDALEIFADIQQGTEEWTRIRAGIPTASCFSLILAKGRSGGESIGRRKYLLKLVGERLTGEVVEGFSNAHMADGHEKEPEAREWYAMTRDVQVQQVGFMKRCGAGASPDGLVDADGGVEIKRMLPHILIECHLQGRVPPEHIPQVMGLLHISTRSWWDFVGYWPGIKPFCKRVERDESYIARLAAEVAEFQAELDEITERIRAL